MTHEEVRLLEEFVELKIKRMLNAALIACDEAVNETNVMNTMLPIEARLEQIKNFLLTAGR